MHANRLMQNGYRKKLLAFTIRSSVRAPCRSRRPPDPHPGFREDLKRRILGERHGSTGRDRQMTQDLLLHHSLPAAPIIVISGSGQSLLSHTAAFGTDLVINHRLDPDYPL